jgi:hypothetical protein
MFNSSMGNDGVEVFKCHVMIYSSFVYLTKKESMLGIAK